MSYEITKPTVWFFKTVNEMNSAGVPRLRCLPGQYILSDDGSTYDKIDDELNVQSDTKPRKENPVGSIFASKVISKTKTGKGTPFYSIGERNIICIDRGVSADIEEAYKEYLKQMGEEEEEEPATTATPAGISVIDQLLRDFPLPTVTKDGFYVEKSIWTCLLFNIHKGYNTMLVGESGTGKTELTQIAAKALGKDIQIFDMAAKQDPIASLIGVHRFDGKSVFDRADFTYAIEKPGLVVLDELPRAPMNTNNILFPVLDSRRTLSMDIASHELRSIKVHNECHFIATANEGFRYTGNNVLDQALKERFHTLVIEFMPRAQEVDLLTKRTGVSKKDAEVIVASATKIRELAKTDELNNGVSIRHTLYAADLCAAGMKVVHAMEASFLQMYSNNDEAKRVKDILSSR